MSGISVRLPLSIDATDGPYSLHKNLKESVKQNLKMLLLTIPGERVMDPNFGVGLLKFLFENDTQDLRSKLHERIRNQVNTYLPFLKVRETISPTLESSGNSSARQINITINYYIEPIAESDILNITLTDASSEGENLTTITSY